MAIEAKRKCGYRKIGGLYLCGTGVGIDCHRLPMEVHACPVCSCGIKYSRGFTWLDAHGFFGKCDEKGACHKINCAVCSPPEGKHGLMWIGKKFYTPDEFTKEASLLGISKRISVVPRNFKLGETWIYLAHLEAGERLLTEEEKENMKKEEIFCANDEIVKRIPAVFYCFKPQRIEKIITESQSKNDIEMERLRLQGITPIVVPENDADHKGSVHDKK